jgi:hypothetical protein
VGDGSMVLDMLRREHTNPKRINKQKPMKWIFMDSLVIAGIAVCAAMPSTIPTIADAWIMFKAFMGSFIFQLAIERGIKRNKK